MTIAVSEVAVERLPEGDRRRGAIRCASRLRDRNPDSTGAVRRRSHQDKRSSSSAAGIVGDTEVDVHITRSRSSRGSDPRRGAGFNVEVEIIGAWSRNRYAYRSVAARCSKMLNVCSCGESTTGVLDRYGVRTSLQSTESRSLNSIDTGLRQRDRVGTSWYTRICFEVGNVVVLRKNVAVRSDQKDIWIETAGIDH